MTVMGLKSRQTDEETGSDDENKKPDVVVCDLRK
jgi:hypothetical protein